MDALQLQVFHNRIRNAQLPGYSLDFADGPNEFPMRIEGHFGETHQSRDHSWSVLMEWADEVLTGLGA